MTDAVEKEFQFRRGNLMLFPYTPNVGPYREEALMALYKRLKDEDLWDVVFHENTEMSLLEFMNFFSGPRNLLQILVLVDGENVVDLCGMAWLTDIESCQNILTRALASIFYFKEYQKPMYTDQFAEMILEYWFEVLKVNTVLGMFPEPNKAIQLYVKRAGFKEVGRLPQYTTFKDEIVTGVITSMTRDDYRKLGG